MALAVIACDQLTKWWALQNLADHHIDAVWTLRFTLAYNTGASFSVGGGYGPWIALVALAVVGFLLWQGRTIGTRLGAVALGMIIGGAFGNLLDRAFRGGGFFQGAVVDFIDLQWWPVFNVADMGVVIGGVLLVISSLFRPEN